jgi:hypothetical protein
MQTQLLANGDQLRRQTPGIGLGPLQQQQASLDGRELRALHGNRKRLHGNCLQPGCIGLAVGC